MDRNRKMTISLAIAYFVLIPIVWGSPTPFGADKDPKYVKEIVRYSKSAEMRNYLNATNDPCDNFYNFACGNYYRLNRPYESLLQSNIFHSMSNGMNRKFEKLLKSDDATYTATDKKVKYFYESCLKLEARNKNKYGAKLREIISEFGQMPVLQGDQWREHDFDWVKTVAEISRKYDIRIILGHFVHVDLMNNTENRVYITLQDIPLGSPSVYTDDTHGFIQMGRKNVIAERLNTFFGTDMKLAHQTAEEIFEFETNLFAGYQNNSEEEKGEQEGSAEVDLSNEAEDSSSTSIEQYLGTIDEIQRNYTNYSSQLDIQRLLGISLGLLPTDKVYGLIEEDVENIAITMENTPKRILANYIFYYLMENFMLKVPKKKNELDKKCIQTTRAHFSQVLDNMIYRKYTTNTTELDIQYMWHTIKSAFHNVLQSDKLTWMKLQTRNYAVEKLNGMRLEINSHAQTNFNAEFAQLVIDNHDYVENIKSIFALKAIKTRRKLKEPPRTYSDSQSLSFTPVYLPSENLIKVPVAMLQPFYLWSDMYPNALKFSTLGFLIAHELIHGFDEDGRTYDKLGNQHEWWDKPSNEYFTNQTECFNAQYQNYTYNGHHLPEYESQSENIADNSGIRLAYNAYLQWYEDALRTYQNLQHESMPLLNYTSKQLFFISYGQLWCGATHPILRSVVADTDDHAPGRFRVIGPLSNLEEFSKEFYCPVGSGMNPKKKCIIY